MAKASQSVCEKCSGGEWGCLTDDAGVKVAVFWDRSSALEHRACCVPASLLLHTVLFLSFARTDCSIYRRLLFDQGAF